MWILRRSDRLAAIAIGIAATVGGGGSAWGQEAGTAREEAKGQEKAPGQAQPQPQPQAQPQAQAQAQTQAQAQAQAQAQTQAQAQAQAQAQPQAQAHAETQAQAQEEDALAPYRERFRQGMEKYKAGAMAEAIRAWSAIYDEIGPQRGYRLSFDLARAYEANSETSRAAERYQSFLDEVGARRAAGETLAPIVEREAEEALRRLDELNKHNGRIRIEPEGRTVLTQIDSADPRLGAFVAYVAPGNHVVVFAPGAPEQERRDVSLKAGDLVVISPAPLQESPAPRVGPEPRPEPARRTEIQHPFSPAYLFIGGGVSAVSVIVPVLTYAYARSFYNNNNNFYMNPRESPVQRAKIQTNYQDLETSAYATLAVPIALTAVTGALVYYWFRGAKEREITVGASVGPGGAALTLGGAM